jgi:hypothetical protein
MPKKYQIVSLLAASLFVLTGNAGYSQLNSEDDDQWRNWEMYITPKSMPKYLGQPQSKVQPLTIVSITYMQPPRVPLSLYEDLYYTANQPIGCKRKSNPININPGTAGIIKITAVNSTEQAYAAANSALRAFVDVSLHRCMTKYVQVPSGAFDVIVAALCNLGLHRHSQSSSENGIGLEIDSDRGNQSIMLFQ